VSQPVPLSELRALATAIVGRALGTNGMRYGSPALPDGYDPDTFVRTFGVQALPLIGVPLPPRETDEERDECLLWNEIERAYAHTPGTALWWEEGYAELWKHKREAERQRREHEAIKRARAEHGTNAVARASAYLSQCPSGVRGEQRNPTAWNVVLRVTRGFALDEQMSIALLTAEYAGRCKPSLHKRELAGMVRRAGRASAPPWGYLLARRAA
jgi:hypothetical protein